MMSNIQKFVFPANNTAVTTIEYAGQPMFILSSVAASLEYANPRDLLEKVRGSWKEEFGPGEVVLLKGAELAAAKSVIGETPDSQNVLSIALVSEEAIYKIAMRARTKKAREFRDWVARDVIPSFLKGQCSKDDARFQVLYDKIDRLEAKLDGQQRLLPAPITRPTYSAEEIGKYIGCNRQCIGRLATEMGIRENTEACVLLPRVFNGHEAMHALYYDAAIPLFDDALELRMTTDKAFARTVMAWRKVNNWK